MEFSFNLNEIFMKSISKLNYNMLPSDFTGDRRNSINAVQKVAEVINEMGLASAKAQALQHTITSAEKMRNSDHILYLMIDPDDNNKKGSVVGILKIGVKNLFLFDETGMVHEKKSMCILDFYVHESKQRTGLGKKLYDFMLNDNHVEPCKLAIDRPSEKLLSFLYKHYGMAKIYPQTNNFVLFEGFFDNKDDEIGSVVSLDLSVASDRIDKLSSSSCGNHSVKSDGYQPTLYGRHTASKPCDTIGKLLAWQSPSYRNGVDKIIHHTT